MPKAKALRIKRGDQVRVVSGKHRGQEGKVMAVYPESNRVVIENVNTIKKAERPTQQNPRGGFSEREASIHASNVRVLDPKTGEPTRVGYKFLDSGEKVRISVKTGTQFDK
jgi:large subunit ribosomal protein L24